MGFCRSPFALTPLEIASGLVLGSEDILPGTADAPPAGSARAALRSVMLPALAAGPCVVSFSGGRDSSAVLAVATEIARAEGLPLPIPATNVFRGAPRADESVWQEQVIRHLELHDWVRVELHEELDCVGPLARSILERHGLLWPFNAHFHAPLLEAARGGTLLTGIGGDELLGTSEWARAGAVLARAVRPVPRDVLRVALVLSPRPVRRKVLQRRGRGIAQLGWLTPAANTALDRAVADTVAAEPLRWSTRWSWWRRRRETRIGLESLGLVARDRDAEIAHPLTDRAFVSAVARMAAAERTYDRTALMRALFSDLLPRPVLERSSKAGFGAVFWGPDSRALAASAAGESEALEVVDQDGLRRAWAVETPDAHSFLLLQAIAVRRAAAGEEANLAISAVAATVADT